MVFKIGEFCENILQFYLSSIDSSMKFALRKNVGFNFVKIFVSNWIMEKYCLKYFEEQSTPDR